MSQHLFAALAAIWLTGMIPLAAADASGGLRWTTHRERFALYWGWPVILATRFWPFVRGAGLRR